MAVSREYQDFVLDLLRPLSPLARRMFGGVGLFQGGVMFALLADDTLHFRVDERARPRFEAAGCMPFHYRRGGREVSLTAYYAVPDDLFDRDDALLDWARDAVTAALAARRR